MSNPPDEQSIFNQMRQLALRAYGPGSKAPPQEHELLDQERLARLRAIIDNPYNRLVFDGLSTIELARICANAVLEQGDVEQAGKMFTQIAKLEAKRPILNARRSAPDAEQIG